MPTSTRVVPPLSSRSRPGSHWVGRESSPAAPPRWAPLSSLPAAKPGTARPGLPSIPSLAPARRLSCRKVVPNLYSTAWPVRRLAAPTATPHFPPPPNSAGDAGLVPDADSDGPGEYETQSVPLAVRESPSDIGKPPRSLLPRPRNLDTGSVRELPPPRPHDPESPADWPGHTPGLLSVLVFPDEP